MESVASKAHNPGRQPRRGQQLETVLLESAWNELVEVGLANLTMKSVAARAHTGVAVLYRGWATKDELVLAAIDQLRSSHLIDLPDTGSLRGDLLAVLTGMGEARAPLFATVVAAASSRLLADTGLTPTEVSDRVMGGQRVARVRSIYQRALGVVMALGYSRDRTGSGQRALVNLRKDELPLQERAT